MKHGRYIELFSVDIKKWEFVNPARRVELYQQFKVV